MDSFLDAMKENLPFSEEDQKKAAQAISGSIDPKYIEFVQKVTQMIKDGSLDLTNPLSLINPEVYAGLDEEWKDKTDLILTNIVDKLKLIVDFFESSDTPDESPQLATMIEDLWQTKQTIEEEHDVFIF